MHKELVHLLETGCLYIPGIKDPDTGADQV